MGGQLWWCDGAVTRIHCERGGQCEDGVQRIGLKALERGVEVGGEARLEGSERLREESEGAHNICACSVPARARRGDDSGQRGAATLAFCKCV